MRPSDMDQPIIYVSGRAWAPQDLSQPAGSAPAEMASLEFASRLDQGTGDARCAGYWRPEAPLLFQQDRKTFPLAFMLGTAGI